jgi:hypothetical protein
MEMTKEAEKALRASIKHWEIDVLKNNVFPKTDNCPLCLLYFIEDCRGCPIAKKTGHDCCHETPYRNYIRDTRTGDWRKRCRKMIKFMKDLLPTDAKKAKSKK